MTQVDAGARDWRPRVGALTLLNERNALGEGAFHGSKQGLRRGRILVKIGFYWLFVEWLVLHVSQITTVT